MAGMILLNGPQLGRLASLVRKQEEANIFYIKFESENDQAAYLRECKANYTTAMEILDAGDNLVKEFKNDPARDSIAHDIYSTIEGSLNSAFQWVRNYTLRMSYLQKIKSFSTGAIDIVKTLDTSDTEFVRDLAKATDDYKKAMWELNKKCMSSRTEAVANMFDQMGSRATMDTLIERAQEKLKLRGSFDKLNEEDKIRVYEKVMDISGEEKLVSNAISKIFGAAGIAVLLFAAGMMVWDIYTSDHPIRTATHDGVVAAASFAGAWAGEFIGTVVATELVGAETFAAATVVAVAGLAFSFAGAVILGLFAGWLIDSILSSKPSNDKPLSTDGLRCYVAPMPDGVALAHQIARDG
ncbi:hypothetical protein CFOL_v3_29778 [Cephalotus follicularis]|uniref:Uncharacterized protein n=1 Tax=Cephalotus follicularis TaxID=3775 RepID=A0A1Q3D1J0_CEPFO|nr:hypothetical protein CFOL_v3_29778 [Cephalotus follicularis]